MAAYVILLRGPQLEYLSDFGIETTWSREFLATLFVLLVSTRHEHTRVAKGRRRRRNITNVTMALARRVSKDRNSILQRNERVSQNFCGALWLPYCERTLTMGLWAPREYKKARKSRVSYKFSVFPVRALSRCPAFFRSFRITARLRLAI